jgi:hypothetical protein
MKLEDPRDEKCFVLTAPLATLRMACSAQRELKPELRTCAAPRDGLCPSRALRSSIGRENVGAALALTAS